jgi:hypothetical protein
MLFASFIKCDKVGSMSKTKQKKKGGGEREREAAKKQRSNETFLKKLKLLIMHVSVCRNGVHGDPELEHGHGARLERQLRGSGLGDGRSGTRRARTTHALSGLAFVEHDGNLTIAKQNEK